MTSSDTLKQDTPKKAIKPVSISMGGSNTPIGREKQPEKKNCGCGGKGCNTHKADTKA